MGVFSSWDTAEKNCCSFSISSCNLWFAACKLVNAKERFLERVFRLLSKIPSSSFRFSLKCQSRESCDIFWAMLLILKIGFVTI